MSHSHRLFYITYTQHINDPVPPLTLTCFGSHYVAAVHTEGSRMDGDGDGDASVRGLSSCRRLLYLLPSGHLPSQYMWFDRQCSRKLMALQVFFKIKILTNLFLFFSIFKILKTVKLITKNKIKLHIQRRHILTINILKIVGTFMLFQNIFLNTK